MKENLKTFLEEVVWNKNDYTLLDKDCNILANGTAEELYHVLGFYIMERLTIVKMENMLETENGIVFHVHVEFNI